MWGGGVNNWSKLPIDSTKKLPTRKSVKITDVVYAEHLTNFVSTDLQLHNRYCQIVQIS